MQIYDQDSKPLASLIADASSEQGATLLVPDLQRPYVWTPNQVILLVDSLLRGWPFGTLLLWEVRKDKFATIPSRSFWRVVDRTGENVSDDQVSRSNPPAKFRMVLDGQQRLQSLLLAFGGDSWGFRLLDREWSAAMESETPRGRYARKHWSLGHLCLDLQAFSEAFEDQQELNRLEFRDVLAWVVGTPSDGRSTFKRPSNYKYPIPASFDPEYKGRFVRLSRFWSIAASRAGTMPRHYRDDVNKLLQDHDVEDDVAQRVLDALSELILTLARVQQEKVSYLWLKPFNERDHAQDVYNDAIVNIFTRLNTAGRALTRQEITFAWIKTGWDASRTNGRTAGTCFDDLSEELASTGVSLDIDAIVGSVSAMWSVLFRKGVLLTANDLLRGEKVRPMAQDLVVHWDTFTANAVESASIVRDRGFQSGTHYRSLNVLTLLICWRLLGYQWLASNPQTVTTSDGVEKALDAEFNAVCDRWIIMSQWSGRWGRATDKAMAEYVGDLAIDWVQLSKETEPTKAIAILRSRMEGWIDALQVDSLKYIENLAVPTRKQVHQYFLALWLWHRLGTQPVEGVRAAAARVETRETPVGGGSHRISQNVGGTLERSPDGRRELC